MPQRRFPPPWSVEETDDCFIVRDAKGQMSLRSSTTTATQDSRKAAHVGQHANDQLASFHLKRLLNGATGTRIAME